MSLLKSGKNQLDLKNKQMKTWKVKWDFRSFILFSVCDCALVILSIFWVIKYSFVTVLSCCF